MANLNFKKTLNEIIDAHTKAESYRQANTTNRYPVEFKIKVKSALRNGLPALQIHRATGIKLATLSSWRKDTDIEEDIICFEAVRTPSAGPNVRIIFPSGLQVAVPLSFLESRIDDWLLKGGVA